MQAVLDRFTQVEPTVLLAVEGYRYGRHTVSRIDELAAIRRTAESAGDRRRAVSRAEHARRCWRGGRGLGPARRPARRTGVRPGRARPSALCALFVGHDRSCRSRSCTATAASCSNISRCSDCTPTCASDRFFWFTTTGWMMWNYLVSELLRGARLVLFDGDPNRSWHAVAARRRRGSRTSASARRSSPPVAEPASRPAGSSTCRRCAPSAPRRSTPARRVPLGVQIGLARRHVVADLRVAPAVCSAFVGGNPLTPRVGRRDPVPVPGLRGCRLRRGRPISGGGARASSSSRSRCRRCLSASGATPTSRATAPPTSSTSRACSATATESRSPSVAAA